MTVTSSENPQVDTVAGSPSDSAARIFGGRFRVTETLKRSRGIETLRAVDESTGNDVVIKATTDVDIPASTRLRLEHEAGILNQIENDSLVSVIDCGSDKSQLFLAMSFVSGSTLEQRLAQSALSIEETIAVAESLLQALEAAHDHGVLHRDIKPANVIVNDGTVTRATLIDFGLARSSHLAASIRDQPVGTALYMSPEMAGLVDQPIDEPSDLYSVGIMLFECLAGHPPFQADSMSEVLRQHAAVKPPELRSLGRQVPQAIDEVIQRLLRKDPRDRYQSANAVLADLNSIRTAWENGEREIELVVGLHDHRRTLTEPAFVGRQLELAQLENRALQTETGAGDLLVVEADSGGGKSRLLSELAQRLARKGMLVLRGHGLDQVAQRPLQVLSGVVDDVIATAQRDDDWAERVRSRLGDFEEAIGASLPELSRELGWRHSRLLGPEAFGETRSLQSLTALLDALGDADRPTVVILDDCQWADDLTVKLLIQWQRLQQNGDARHVTVIAAWRSEEVQAGHPLREIDSAFSLSLPPFQPQDVRKLAESMAGPLPDDAVGVVERFADGSPFMASAVLRGLVESQALIPGESGWEIDALALADVQSSHHAGAFLARRIELLPADTLSLLTVAAVLGKEFDLETLALVAGEAPPMAIVGLTEARRRHLVWTVGEGTQYAFAHDQVRETLRRRLPEEDLRQLHDRAARCIEKASPDRVFELAFHYGAAGKHEHALPYALEGAAQARSQNALQIAEQLFRIAADGAATNDAQMQCQVAEGLGDVLMLRGKYQAATDQFREAQKLAADNPSRARIDGKLGEVAFKQGDMETAVAGLESALRLLGQFIPRSKATLIPALLWEATIQVLHTIFGRWIRRRTREPSETERIIIRLHGRMTYAYWFARGALPCLWTHMREMNLSERCGPSLERAQAYSTHAPVMSLLPYFSRAIQYVETSLDIRRSFDDIWGQGQSLHFYGVVLYAASRFDDCIEKCREAIRLLERTGDYWEVNIARYQLAASLYRQGKLKEAISESRRIHESGLELGDAQASGISLDIWARAARGRLPADRVRTEVERDRFDPQGTTQVLVAEGVRLLQGEGDAEAAAEVFQKAHQVAKDAEVENAWVSPALPWLATALREAAVRVDPYDPEKRRTLLRRAVKAARRGRRMAWKFQNDLPHALRELGLLAALDGQTDKARRFLDKSIAVAERQGAAYEHAQSLLARGQVGLRCHWSGAEEEVARARDLIDAMEDGTLEEQPGEVDEMVTLSLADRFDTLLETGRTIASSLTRKSIMSAVQETGMRLLRAEHCLILEVSSDGDNTTFAVTTGESEDLFRESTARQAIAARRALAMNEEMSEGASESVVLPGTRSVLCAPIFVGGEVEACLYATHRQVVSFFGQDEAQLADFIAAIAGAALENAESFKKLEELRDELFANKMTLEMRVNERTAELQERRIELEAQRKELERSNEELAQFAYVASHDLKAPLRTVGSYCHLVKSQYGESLEPKAVDFIDRAMNGVERMTLLIDDLLEYSRVNTHQRPFEPSKCSRLVERVLSGLKASIVEYEATVTFDDDLPTVMADVIQLERVFQNLISNAIKFRAPDRPICVHVGATRKGDFWEFSIRDTGIGIDPDHFERIFQIFQRLHGTKKYEGTGIGLAVVKKTIENHGGEIRVESTVGEGSTFYLTLPVCEDSGDSEENGESA